MIVTEKNLMISINNEQIKEPVKVANQFLKHFKNVQVGTVSKYWLKIAAVEHSIFLRPTIPQEIITLIMQPPKFSTGIG